MMDRFVVREPRVGADYPQQGNQMLQFSPGMGNNRNMVPETMYFGGYGAEFPVQRSPGFMGVTHVSTPRFSPNLPSPNQNVMSGIDPRYLAAYADNSASFIAGHRQQMERDQTTVPPNGPTFANDYQNRPFIGADRNIRNTFTAQVASSPNVIPRESSSMTHLQPKNTHTPNSHYEYNLQNTNIIPRESSSMTHLQPKNTPTPNSHYEYNLQNTNMIPRETSSMTHLQPKNIPTLNSHHEYNLQNTNSTTTVQILPKTSAKDNDAQKTSIQFPVPLKTRGEKLRDLHKTGARAFSGPVEKVLKWHKTLQEMGLLVLYEIVAKCVSVRSGESCAKTLVVRDDSGPAIQVVYYEIDFLLPELKPPCTVRVIGRMMPGTCRLQAFSVRQATGDDVSTLPRRAAVAAHNVSKL